MVVASFNHSLSSAHYEGFLPCRKEHKFKSGKGGAMLGVTFQSVKDGFFTRFDSSKRDENRSVRPDNSIESEAVSGRSLLFVEHC